MHWSGVEHYKVRSAGDVAASLAQRTRAAKVELRANQIFAVLSALRYLPGF